MKTKTFVFGAVLLMAPVLLAVAAESSPSLMQSKTLRYEFGERGANHRVVNKVVAQTNWLGAVSLATNLAYVEIAAGLQYQDSQGVWRDSKEEFTLVPGWAVARKGQHKVSLAYNLNTAGPVATELPDGRIMRSQVLSLHYLDSTTGQSVRIAEIKNCVGVMIAPNQILYTNAFAGVNADVRFTYTKSGIEQDIVLRAQPPTPASLGLNPATTRLAVLTEFLNPPAPVIKQLESDGGSVDDELEFGSMRIGRGRAFAQGTNRTDRAPGRQISVTKRWMQSNGRTFLLEQVPLPEVSAELDKLPKQAGLSSKSSPTLMAQVSGTGVSPVRTGTETHGRDARATTDSDESKLLASLDIPAPRLGSTGDSPVPSGNLPDGREGQAADALRDRSAQVPGGESPPGTGESPVLPGKLMEIAQVWQEPVGFVLDYLQMNSSLTNFTFQSNMTYLVSGRVDLWGTTTLEGGAVMKFAPVDSLLLVISDSSMSYLWCKTSPYRPAFFTSRDENSIGEIISGSTGNPAVWGATNNLYLTLWAMSGLDVHDIKMSYSHSPLWVFGSSGEMSNIQIDHSYYPFWGIGANMSLRNILLHDVRSVGFWLNSSTLSVEHMTVDGCGPLGENESASSMTLTNSLLVGVQTLGNLPLTTNSVAITGTNTPVFQSVGVGSHYLVAGSAYRDVGTANINPVLLAALQQMTTYPPPDSYADANALDLGFHYPRLTDWDNDGLEDGWELRYFGNLNQTGSGDFDADGVSNLMEFIQGRNPAAGAAPDNGATALKTFTPLK